MRYRLRTLMIVLAIVPPVLAGAWPFAKPKPRGRCGGCISIYSPPPPLPPLPDDLPDGEVELVLLDSGEWLIRPLNSD